MSNDKNNEELTRDTERLLQSFAPRGGELDRDRLMFLAGQAIDTAGQASSGTVVLRAPWFWKAATAGMTTVAAVLLVALVMRSEPAERIVIQEKIVYVQQSPPAESPANVTLVDRPKAVPATPLAHSPEGHYLRARDLLIAGSIDAASAPAYRSGGAASSPSSYRDLLEEMVPRKRPISQPPGLSWPVLLLDEMNM